MTPSSLPPSNNLASTTPAFSVGTGQTSAPGFQDRRSRKSQEASGERRQFGSSHSGLSPDGHELAVAIDQYKLEHHRRYITCDEMLDVLAKLGYTRS